MSGTPGAGVAALSAVLVELAAQQQTLVARLQALHTRLASGDAGEAGDEELLVTLTYYVNQTSFIRRRMTLLQGRVSDLKSRSLRLGEHRAQQSRQVAEWVHQERQRVVPAAPIATAGTAGASAASARMHTPVVEQPVLPLQAASTHSSPLPRKDAEPDCRARSVPAPTGLAGWFPATGLAASGLGVLLPRPAPDPAAPRSPALSDAPAPAAQEPAPDAAAPIAMVKRRGKRRVRMPTIE